MTKDIKALREKKFPNPFCDPPNPFLGGYILVFIVVAIIGFFITCMYVFHADGFESKLLLPLFVTSVGCISMTFGFIVVRKKVRSMNRYQEQLVQVVYDTLEHFEREAKIHEQRYYDLKSRLNSITYLSFRNSMCPEIKQFKAFKNVVQGDLDQMDISSELIQNLNKIGVYSPEYIIRKRRMISQSLGNDFDYLSLYKKACALHPLISQLNAIQYLFEHVLDSLEDYYEAK